MAPRAPLMRQWRLLHSSYEGSDGGPSTAWHEERLCKAAKPSPKKMKMCSTEGAGNHHEVETQRACDVAPRMHGFILSRSHIIHGFIYRLRKKHNVNKSRLSASIIIISSDVSVSLSASLFHPPRASLPRSCPARFPTHSYLGLEGHRRKYKIATPRPDLRSKPCSPAVNQAGQSSERLLLSPSSRQFAEASLFG